MSETEFIMGMAFLLAATLAFMAHREGRGEAGLLRNLLIGNVALSAMMVFGEDARSVTLVAIMAAIGATECGYWAARGLAALLPERDKGAAWGWDNDKPGVVIAAALGIGFLAFIVTVDGRPGPGDCSTRVGYAV